MRSGTIESRQDAARRAWIHRRENKLLKVPVGKPKVQIRTIYGRDVRTVIEVVDGFGNVVE